MPPRAPAIHPARRAALALAGSLALGLAGWVPAPVAAQGASAPAARAQAGKSVKLPQAASKATGKADPKTGKGKASGQKSGHRVQADSAPDAVTYGGRDDAMALADQLAERHGLDAAWARAQLAQARFQPAVARLIMPPPAGTAKNWAAYRARFIEPERVKAGAAFWAAQQRWLDAAEARYGVPASLVVGIIGVETFYGRVMGNFRVLDALATLSLDFPKGRKDRSEFFRDELGQFLRLAHTEKVAAVSIKGSFAGAMGLGQFMPGSVNRFAVDFDGDGHIDMAGGPDQSAADVIGSVAHYLAEHGWQRGMPTHYAVKPPVDTADRATLLAPDILPSFTAAQMTERGAVLDAAGAAHTGPLALVELQNGNAAPSHVAGTQNFYAVTRYNWSSYYALAVIELGQAVAAAR
jgi:membrane-bound lytic murein transglycosylase B